MRIHNYHDINETLKVAIEIELGLKKEKLHKSRGYKGSWTITKKRDLPLTIGERIREPRKIPKSHWSKNLK